MLEEGLGQRDELEVPLVALTRGVAPGEEAVEIEHHRRRVRLFVERVRRRLAETEPGHDVRHDHDVVAQRLAHEVVTVLLIGQGEDGVGVGVVDELRRQEGVEQRLDRRVGRRRVEQMAAKLVHHLDVGQRVEVAEPAQVGEVEAGQAGRLDRVEVPTRALDVDRLDRLAEEVAVDALDRGVPAAVHHQRRLRADQARGVDAQREVLAPGGVTLHELARFLIRPATLHVISPPAKSEPRS